MAGKGLSELQLKEEAVPELDYDKVPEFGSWAPPPQPGTYTFRLPAKLDTVYEPYSEGEGTLAKEYLRVLFDSDAPLTITKAGDPALINTEFETRLTNKRRPRGRDKIEVSDLDLLLRAMELKQAPKTNRAFAEALMQFGGKEFKADIGYSWVCNKARVRRIIEAGTGKNIEDPSGAMGCGAKYYQDDKTQKPEQKVARGVDGKYPYEILCACGNVVRAFANLDNLRAA